MSVVLILSVLGMLGITTAQKNNADSPAPDLAGANQARTNQTESTWPAPGAMIMESPAPQKNGALPTQTNKTDAESSRLAIGFPLQIAPAAQTNQIQTPWPSPGVMIMPPPPPPKTWADYVTINGNLRLREEVINDDAKKKANGEHYTRDRMRLKAQLGAEAKLDDLKAGLRISTGGADPVSANMTLGDGAQKKEIRFDLAYLEYNFFGDNPYELRVIGGKMNNPLIAYGADDLMWDQDLTPEGIAAKSRVGNDWVTALVNAEYLYIKERDSQPNAWAWAGQGALQFTFVPEAVLTLGGGYVGFQNFKGYDVIDWENKNNSYGNSTIKGTVSGNTTNKAWAADFTPIMGFGNLDLFLWKVPVSIYGQALSNPGADDNNKGYMGGISLFKAKNPNTVEFGYSYAKLEKDATLGMWTDSDRWGGGTDGKGSRFYGKYQITKYLQFAVNFYLDKKNIADNETESSYNRLQVDLQGVF